MLSYYDLYALGALIVDNVALWGDSSRFDSVDKGDVPSLHFGVNPILQWGNECYVAVNFHNYHDVFVYAFGMEEEAASLV